jgi:flagellar hook-length control protein FliK
MNRTNLEYLFQATGPVSDRGFSATARDDESRPGFGDHLSKAASANGTKNTQTSSDRGDSRSQSSSDRESRSAGDVRDAKRSRAKGKSEDADRSEQKPSVATTDDDATPTMDTKGAAADPNAAPADERSADEEALEAAKDAAVTVVAAVMPVAATEATAELTENSASAATEREATADTFQGNGGDAAAKAAGTGVSAVDVAASNASDESGGQSASEASVVEQNIATTSGEKRVAQAKHAKESDQAVHSDVKSQITSTVNANSGEVTTTDSNNTTVTESAIAEAALSETGPSGEVESSTDENRDADARTSPGPRSESAVMTEKTPTTAVANLAVPRAETATNAETTEVGTNAGKTSTTKLDGVNAVANRLQSSQGAARRGARTNGTDEAPHVDPARFVGRVAKAFHTAQERGGTLQIRLSPPELGAMRLELSVKDGVMTASLETENASARRVLLEHLPALRDRLAEQNIRIERFDVDVRRDGSGGGTDPRATQDQHQPQQGGSERRPTARPSREPAAPQATASVLPSSTNNTGLNLVA